MKKIFLFAVAIMLMFSGCGPDEYNEYYITCDHDYAAMDTYYVPVNSILWTDEPSFNDGGDGPYIYYTHNMPQITENVIENGIVLVYLIENGRDNILPYLRPWGINTFDEPFSQNVRFDIEEGKITFITELSDLEFPAYPAGALEFKVVVLQNFVH
jgi:hypothetical protein